MKKTVLILLYFASVFSLCAQDYTKNDTLSVEKKSYDVVHISYGKTNQTKYFKVFTCDSKLKKRIVTKIKQMYPKKKREYSEIYIVFINDLKNVNSKVEDKIVVSFLEKIDKERMKVNLSTAIVKFNYDYKTDTFTYYPTQPRIDFKKLDILCNRITLALVDKCLK